MRASQFRSGVVASRPYQMYAWPGLCRIRGGQLIAVASERKYHVCPFGRLVIIRSEDDGDSWGLPQEIYNGELDDRDPAIVEVPDGTLVVGFPTTHEFAYPRWSRPEWQPRTERLTERVIEELGGDWVIRSTDSGGTWETSPHRMPDGGGEHGGPFALSDGSLASFGYELSDTVIRMFYYRSLDLGDTWERLGSVPHELAAATEWPWRISRGRELSGPTINERALLELAPNHYLAMFRSKDGFLRQVRTIDGGREWQDEGRLAVWGFPPHLLRLGGGEILCSYGHRADPWSIQAVISYDEGKTWDVDNRIMVHEWEDRPDMGYPVALEIARGEILTIFYANRRDRDPADRARAAGPDGILFKKYTLSSA